MLKAFITTSILPYIDYDNAIDLEFRHGMKQFFSGDVSQPVHSSGIKGKTGEHIHCLFQGMLLPEEDEHYLILGTIKDITTFSEKEQELETKAQADSLTGLFNHAHGMELVTKAPLAKNPFDTCAFVIVDLDFFKQINDTYGHLFGDHVLRETANIFKDVLPSDTIISRFGGDEFILFFPNISRIDLIQKLNLLMQHIHNVEMLNDTDNLTCSMGICFVPENTASYTYDQLMENADRALYQAKDNRRDTYIFCDDMNRYQELRNADSSNKNKIDARYFQNDTIATAFEVMETCLSVEEGISMLLKIIGMRFHLDRISIIDMNLNDLTAAHAYCWTTEYVTKLYPFLKLRLRSGIYHVTGKCQTATEAIDAANFARKSLLSQPHATSALYNEEMAAKQQLERIIFANANTAFTEEYFKVFLQPKFALKDNALIGAEALVRWFHEDGSQIYPNQFIPALEDNGRITELDFFVFECVAKFLAKNKKLGRKQVPISINASAQHTYNDDTVQRYLEILERYQIEPSLVEIELTETATAQNYDKVYQLFDELRHAGIKTSLDDFGAGYSLVNMVVDIPIDTVKIDRQLLLSCETSVKGHIFLKNSIAMLHSLGYSIICEGVETDAQRQLLMDCGCYKGQGYLFSRPIPISEYEARFYDTNE